MEVNAISKTTAAAIVESSHYLHRRPPISFAFGLLSDDIRGVCTFGVPASRHLQKSACKSDPSKVIELNRLWIDDSMKRNTATWFLSRCLKQLPPFIIVSYADTTQGHIGYVYRAANFRYYGWTDMDRKTPRYDYVVPTGKHSRDAFRCGDLIRVRRKPKHRYWTATGTRRERRELLRLCTWRSMDW